MMKLQKNKKPLLYMQTAEKVKEEIRRRKLRSHDPVPSEGELAELYSVSRMTAKLALEILAKEGIVYRLPRRGTFMAETQGDAAVQATVAERSSKKRIAMIFPNLDDYTSSIIAAAEREARNSDCYLIVRISTDREDESECLQELYDDRVDGIILYPRGRTKCSEKVLSLNLLNYPLVIIDRIFREVSIDCVYHDHYQGMYNMTEYLIDKGHKEIGYISMAFDGVTSREDRYKGYVQAMLDHGLPINSHNILLQCTEDYMKNLSAPNPQLAKFIGDNPSLTAVVCTDDYLATSCQYTAAYMNRSVPDQLSIVGFSDIQLASLLPVPLTTARQTTEQLGQSSVKLLLKRIENSREGAITIKLNTSIIERSSVRMMQAE
ncbi:substrate-binding domain-containing protein [Paenibacillus protaetiae]|uniref:GntR family transcriptional regulator n=1 Tax=Paenibacillus protaetiae TaxID=2509456 RepID=A0A4P6EXA6_9BACL|nr:GntR family transcriptional regulator [Paenibacillus protaetiae]QAY67285.1 GntR family transcriptional regulator [Paenibacillus protaetiae]